MVNRAAEDTLQEKPTFSSNYIIALEKVNEKRPGIDRDHQDLRPDPLVLQPHQQVPPQPPFVLGERIERNLYNLLETLIAAKYTKNRQRLLEEANLSLEVLRFQMRLAKDLQCLKVESYAFAAKSIDEIGRLVGGWLRSRGEEKRMKRQGNLWTG